MRWLNLTPHALKIEGLGEVPASGTVARVATVRVDAGSVGGVRLVLQNAGRVQDLPAPIEGVGYIVSGMVLDALKRQSGQAGETRPDVYAPDTGPDAIRKDGQIVAVRGLIR